MVLRTNDGGSNLFDGECYMVNPTPMTSEALRTEIKTIMEDWALYKTEMPDAINSILQLIATSLPEKKEKWDAGEYQVIEDALGNKAEQLYEDIRIGYNQAIDDFLKLLGGGE